MEFDSINKQIQEFLKNKDINTYEFADKGHKLPTSDAIFCAEDTPRNRKFFEAIKQAIKDLKEQKNKEEIVIVDAGSGTGLLGIFGLLLGANKCIFIEENPYSIALNKEIVEHFGLTEYSQFLEGDATKIDLKEKFDILVSETIKSNFLNEDFPYIVNHLKKSAKKGYKVIPEGFELEIFDGQKNFIKTQKIDSYTLHIPFNLNLQTGIQSVSIKGTTYFYKDIISYSGDCMSYFNELSLQKDDNSFLIFNNS